MRHIDTEVLQSTLKFNSTSPHKTISHWRDMNRISWRH
jgi:hypothetical protein